MEDIKVSKYIFIVTKILGEGIYSLRIEDTKVPKYIVIVTTILGEGRDRSRKGVHKIKVTYIFI